MKASIYIAISILQILSCTTCFSQKEKIDSLRKACPSLQDSAEIDCLNTISYEYILAEKKDSAEYYVTLAYEEAKRIDYIHGIAFSFLLQSQIAKHFDDDFVRSEMLGKESLRWYERTGNKEGIENLYTYLLYTVFAQSRFDEASDYGEKLIALAKQTGDQKGMLAALGWMFAINRQSGNYEKS